MERIRHMTTDTTERGIERLICTALTGSPLRVAPVHLVFGQPPSREVVDAEQPAAVRHGSSRGVAPLLHFVPLADIESTPSSLGFGLLQALPNFKVGGLNRRMTR